MLHLDFTSYLAIFPWIAVGRMSLDYRVACCSVCLTDHRGCFWKNSHIKFFMGSVSDGLGKNPRRHRWR